MTKAEKAAAARMTREDMEANVREMCIASVRLDETTARMNEALARAREQFEPELAALRETYDGLFEQAQAWADSHPAEFASRKSLVLVHGTMGYRTGQPTLKPTRGNTWESVLDALKAIQPQFVRTHAEVDKEAILANREGLGEENLGTLGLRVVQTERFYCEVNKESAIASACETAAAGGAR